MRMFERFDGSEQRVRAFASKLAKIPGFIRAAPYPSDQLKLFSASAVVGSLFFGEIFAKRCSRCNKKI